MPGAFKFQSCLALVIIFSQSVTKTVFQIYYSVCNIQFSILNTFPVEQEKTYIGISPQIQMKEKSVRVLFPVKLFLLILFLLFLTNFPLAQYRYNLFQIQNMTQNIHRKVLSSNALKTNFISNTNPKNKSENEKRFSNISKEKQTIHKNTARYYEETNMQDSATILPQKNSSRQNIYANQNSNHFTQVTGHQRKEAPQQTVNIKAKSPIDKNRLNIDMNIQNQISFQSQVNLQNQNQAKIILQNKQFSKTIDMKTQRQKSNKIYQKQDQKQLFKIKSMIINKQIKGDIDDDLICNQQIDVSSIPTKQHTRKLSNNYLTKTQNLPNKQDTTGKAGKEETISQNLNDCRNRTEKKQVQDKPTIMLQKTKSEHTIIIKDCNMVRNNSTIANPTSNVNSQITGVSNQSMNAINQPLLINQNSNAISQVTNPLNNSNFSSILQRNSSKHHLNNCNFNFEEQLKKFQSLQVQLNQNAEVETIIHLQNRQRQYIVQPNYIQMRQKHFNWFMRAVLMDWMAHVCFQFQLKRQTYYIAITLVDKYLQTTNDLPKSEFQLVGAACMFISAKLQEFEALSSADFSKSTDNRYSAGQIKQMELRICRTLNYELNSPTIYMWANRFMVHWDSYIQITNAKFHPYFDAHKPKYFKKLSQQSYLLFRQMMQMLDCAILDVQTLQFAPKILICSFMYLVLGKNYKQWPAKRIIQEFPRSSHYLVSSQCQSCFNELFHMFLYESFQLDISQLLPAVQYCSTYFTLGLNFDAPPYAMRGQNEEQGQMNLQQYESFQTYNGKMMDLIKRRFRGVYL